MGSCRRRGPESPASSPSRPRRSGPRRGRENRHRRGGWRFGEPIVGPGWRVGAVGGQRGVLFDSNQWKSFLAERLRTPVGDTGAITFHAGQHEMLIDHLTSESPITVEARGRVVDEWRLSPGRENHYLDATVMNAEIRIHGRACHSAFPEQVENAIYPAGRVILAIEELARELLRRRERGSSTNRRSRRPACRASSSGQARSPRPTRPTNGSTSTKSIRRRTSSAAWSGRRQSRPLPPEADLNRHRTGSGAAEGASRWPSRTRSKCSSRFRRPPRLRPRIRLRSKRSTWKRSTWKRSTGLRASGARARG